MDGRGPRKKMPRPGPLTTNVPPLSLIPSTQVRPVDVAIHASASHVGGGGRMDRAPSFSSTADGSLLANELASAGRPLGRFGGGGHGSAAHLPRPAFGSSPNLQALALDAASADGEGGGPGAAAAAAAAAAVASRASGRPEAAFYEVTVASADQPKLLSRLSDALGDLNLNICEAHAFNTADRFSLDVFVVNGWSGEGTDELEEALSERLQQLPPPVAATPAADAGEANPMVPAADPAAPALPDDFELDAEEVTCHEKVAAGAFGDLYRGVYCGTDVAIKILRNVATDSAQFGEFLQEVNIMRKVRHRNVVQFIGACTQRPSLCIVCEYLPGGSAFDWMRTHGPPRPAQLLRWAADVARGMDYLHKRRVVHRDLKAANLLLDEGGGIKIADFGVARVLDAGPGVLTAETGTYRWMAPEVIEHAPYGAPADVFSFGILLWELLTARVPYEALSPLQAAVGVVQRGLRPTIPSTCPAELADLMRACWTRRPEDRPGFEELKGRLDAMAATAKAAEERKAGGGGAGAGGLLAKLRRGGGGGPAQA